MRVRLTARAARDLARTVDYYLANAPAQASRFADGIDDIRQRLGENPYSAQETDIAGLRRAVMRRFPYLVFYRVADGEVLIVHIRHTSRRPWV